VTTHPKMNVLIFWSVLYLHDQTHGPVAVGYLSTHYYIRPSC